MADIKNKNYIATGLIYIVMGIFIVLAIYPLLWLLIQSFKTTEDYLTTSKLGLPVRWFFDNYPQTWVRGGFPMLIINSIIYTGATTVAVLMLGFMMAFAFAKIPSKATPFLQGSLVIGILLTLQSILIPLFLMIRSTGMYNTRIGVLIPYIGVGLPMCVYLSIEYIKSIPYALIESARLDGAKYLRIFASIILPMSAPVATTVAILQITGTWNEFMLINILVSSESLKSLPVGINRFSGAMSIDYGKQFTALVIGVVPMIIFYMVFRKKITAGVSTGAVKG
jgi:raffinose/stachyose/melibiose transport system permease protein